MNKPLNPAKASHKISDFFHNSREKASSYENIWHLSPEEGTGSIRNIYLRNGLNVVLQDYELALPLLTRVTKDSLPLKFNFCISGILNGEIENSGRDINIRPHESSILSLCGRFAGAMQRQTTEPVKMLTVFFDQCLLRSYLAEDVTAIPDEIRSLLEKRNDTEIKRKITTEMHILLKDIFAFRNEGAVSRMRIEAKILELISSHIQGIIKDQEPSGIPDIEIERVILARDILIRNMEDPPDLAKLSRMTGVSHTKLIQLFRRIYGTTPFSYLRDIRLEKSRELLESGKMNVTETACSVGYSCMSFFAKAFREKYGISPSECQKREG